MTPLAHAAADLEEALANVEYACREALLDHNADPQEVDRLVYLLGPGQRRASSAVEAVGRTLPGARKQPPRKARQSARDRVYLEHVRKLRCQACGSEANIQAHHATGNRGKGQKAGDGNAAALCAVCHMLRHDQGKDWFADRYGTDDELVESTRALVAKLYPNVEIPPRDAPEKPIEAPVMRTGAY